MLSYVGLGLNVAALALAPLALVQTVIAGGLVVVALGAVRMHGGKLRRRDTAAVALMIVAVAALASGPAPPAASVIGARLIPLLTFGGATGAIAGALALPEGPAGRALRLALAAGILYGTTTLALAVLATVRASSPFSGRCRPGRPSPS